jgi:V8-like Glu-specific endopeptidase
MFQKNFLLGAGAVAALAITSATLPSLSAERLLKSVQQHASTLDDPFQWPASSVGKITVPWHTNLLVQCTGTLIGPKLVLTAAHCLFLKDQPAKPTMVHFVLGMNRGEVSAHSVAESFEIAPNHSTEDPLSTIYAKTDWALVRLHDRIEAKPIPVVALSQEQFAKIASGKTAFEIGYGRERLYLPSVAKNCEISAKSDDGIFGHDCLFNFGYSGAPILADVGEGPSVIGVSSLNQSHDGVATAGVACFANQFASEVEKMSAAAVAPTPGVGKPAPEKH